MFRRRSRDVPVDGGPRKPGRWRLSRNRVETGEPHEKRKLRHAAKNALRSASTRVLEHTLWLTPEGVEFTRFVVPIPDLHHRLHGLTVVQISDIHHGPWLPIRLLNGIIDRINGLGADIVVLTGDYISNSPRYIRPVAEALSRLRPAIGVLGVLGNHDWYEGGDLLRTEFERWGLPLIDNARRMVTPSRRIVSDAREGLCIAGVGDLMEHRVDFAAALDGVPAAMPRLLLSHNPDVAEEHALAEGGYRIDLMITGHTHGGQVAFRRMGVPFASTRRRRKYASGMVNGPVCPVFVSRGLGVSILPIRYRVPPEVTVFELVRG